MDNSFSPPSSPGGEPDQRRERRWDCEFCKGSVKPHATYCKHCGINLKGYTMSEAAQVLEQLGGVCLSKERAPFIHNKVERLAYCGEPTESNRTWMTRQPRFEYGGQEIPFEGREDVPVDLWTYDFGPNKLVRRIRFIARKVDSIETREHGKNP